MTQVLPAALVAPTRAGQSVGYQIRAVNGTTIATAFTTTGVAEVSATGYYRVNGGITAPDDGGTLEWYLNNAGSAGAFLSAVAIEPAPNQADQAAGIRAALGLASANVDTQLSAINSKTTNLPAAPAAVGDIPTTTQIWTHATRALTDKDSFNLASSQTFSTTGSVGSVTGAVGSVTGAVGSVTGAVTVGIINNNAITANAIATDAFDADAIAASAVTEIQAGLATQASVDTKASQASVNAIPTTPLLAANYTAPDNAGIAAIKAKTDNLPSDPADQSELVTLINTRLAAADYVAPSDTAVLAAIQLLPTEAEITNAVWNATLSNYLTAGSTGASLASTLALAQAFTLGRFKIDYPNSTATQYNVDGTVRKVFSLLDDQGNPAIDAQSAVDRVPLP